MLGSRIIVSTGVKSTEVIIRETLQRVKSKDPWEYDVKNDAVTQDIQALSTERGLAYEAALAKVISRVNSLSLAATKTLLEEGFYAQVHPALMSFVLELITKSENANGAWIKPPAPVGRPSHSAQRNETICGAVDKIVEESGSSIAQACRKVAKLLMAGNLGNYQDNLSWRTIKNIYHAERRASPEK